MMGRTRITIVEGAVPAGQTTTPTGAGASLVFDGVVREGEPREGDAGAKISALDYEAYEPMAQRMIERIGDELIEKHGLIGMEAVHSKGRVAVGECSFRLIVYARHRKEALKAMDEFIDRLKRDVPIWKKPVWKS